jgi:UbiA prenyltransferase family
MTSVFKTPESNWFYSLWKFSRPHTIIGTTLSVLGIYFITTGIYNQTIPPISLIGAWVACILGNIYIVGLNQLEDIEIDKINKPHLPLAAGEFSISTGKAIVISCGIFALLIAFSQSPYHWNSLLPPTDSPQKISPFSSNLYIFSKRSHSQPGIVPPLQLDNPPTPNHPGNNLDHNAICTCIHNSDRYLQRHPRYGRRFPI